MQSDASAQYRESSVETHEASPGRAQQAFAQEDDGGADLPPWSGDAGSGEQLSDPPFVDADFDNHANAALLKQRLRVAAGAESLPDSDEGDAVPLPRDFPCVPIRSMQPRFHIAACHGREAEILRLMLRAPFSVDGLDVFGRSALHIAAERGHEGPARRLLRGISGGDGGFDLCPERGVVLPAVVRAEVNIRTPFGLTPAHYAAAHGQVEMLALLHKAGGDLGACTDFQATPLDLARAHGQARAEMFLRNLQAHSAGPIWQPSQKFTEALAAWRGDWNDRVRNEGRGGNDDFLSALFGAVHDGLVWPVTPEMKDDLVAFRREWQRQATLAGEFDEHALPVKLSGGHITACWSLPPPLAHDMEALHQRWRDEVLAGLMGVPSWWVQQICEPQPNEQANSPQSRAEALPRAAQFGDIRRGRQP